MVFCFFWQIQAPAREFSRGAAEKKSRWEQLFAVRFFWCPQRREDDLVALSLAS